MLVVGSDNVSDSSVLEAEHLHSLGVVDRLALLKIWTEDTPRAIFPQRRIGFLRDGYEASFLALEGNPLEDWRNIRRIKGAVQAGTGDALIALITRRSDAACRPAAPSSGEA
jgi:imidazolonepropionase-like amidohydrolase